MVQRERDRIWAMIEGAQERNDWTMIQHDGEGEIALGPSMIPEAMRIPCDEEIMPWEEAGSPPSPVTIRAALTNNDNMSEGTVLSRIDRFSLGPIGGGFQGGRDGSRGEQGSSQRY